MFSRPMKAKKNMEKNMVYENILKICKSQKRSVRSIETDEKAKDKIGIGTINKWRNCSPTLEKLEVVADVLGVPVSELIEG